MHQAQLHLSLSHDQALPKHVQQQGIQLHRHAVQGMARIGLRQQQEIAHHASHALGFGFDFAQGFLTEFRVINRAPLQQVQVALNGGQRRTQLVRHIAYQPLLCLKELIEAREHLVEGFSQAADFVAGVRNGDAFGQMFGATDAAGSRSNLVDGSQRGAGKHAAAYRGGKDAQDTDQVKRRAHPVECGLHIHQRLADLQHPYDLSVGAMDGHGVDVNRLPLLMEGVVAAASLQILV